MQQRDLDLQRFKSINLLEQLGDQGTGTPLPVDAQS